MTPTLITPLGAAPCRSCQLVREHSPGANATKPSAKADAAEAMRALAPLVQSCVRDAGLAKS